MDLADPMATRAGSEAGTGVWDRFLTQRRTGQFQQSTMWAEVKQSLGWQVEAVHFHQGESLVGGFRMFWRRTRLGRIGYVTKGPVLAEETDALARFAAASLVATARKLRLVGLVVQPPDDSPTLEAALTHHRFAEDRWARVVDATIVLEMDRGLERIRSGFTKSLRRNLRQADRKGTRMRLGTEEDLPLFHRLMTATCVRRHTRPNPASVGEVRTIWRAFEASRALRLAFAYCGEEPVAATLAIGFGARADLWKTGWTGTHPEWHANELLTAAELEWAIESGRRLCDFGAIERQTARRLLAGADRGATFIDGRYTFLLQFGGQPKLLPAAHFYSPWKPIRWLHRFAHRARGQSQEWNSDRS